MRTEAPAAAATFVRLSHPCFADSAVFRRELRTGAVEVSIPSVALCRLMLSDGSGMV